MPSLMLSGLHRVEGRCYFAETVEWDRVMKNTKSLYHGHDFPPAVISLAVLWFLRFQLGLRDIEELLFERGAIVSYAPKELS